MVEERKESDEEAAIYRGGIIAGIHISHPPSFPSWLQVFGKGENDKERDDLVGGFVISSAIGLFGEYWCYIQLYRK